MANPEDEWFSIDLESKLNRKIDALQQVVQQQTELIQTLSSEIKQMKQHVGSPCSHLSSQNDRTHQLLEELKVIKQRELNMMLREKIPVPFFSTKSSFPQHTASITSLPSPLLFLAQHNRNPMRHLNL
jgi:hypothetical protein